jgi:hypothetical protein
VLPWLQRASLLGALTLALALAGVGCIEPKDRRPGLWLGGEVATEPPSDWSFTDEHREIAIQVRTPYWVPHSVTIFCAVADGQLFVAARDPDEKRWPGWVADEPDVRLGIGGRIYPATLRLIDDPDRIARIRDAYAAKYDMQASPPGGGPPMRYWIVDPRG